jgi:phage I-like protein
VVRLTAEEREIAKLNGMTDQEYARNKLPCSAKASSTH